MNRTSNVLHGKTAKSGSAEPSPGVPDGPDGFDGAADFDGAGFEGDVADGVADGVTGFDGAAGGGTSSGPQAVRASAETAARTTAALRTPWRT
ncbi:hypothetical protein [Streptomyces sp. NPDC046712]|uniref:hypothetical protein n=1 Tax=Streptomyces sp. NPDC046712 TaxID=3154802 RepID=UPI0033DFE982